MTRRAAILGFALLAAVAALPARGQPLPSALSLAAGLRTLADREPQPFPDPFPIRRVLLPSTARLPAAPDGNPFRKMPRAEFENLVRAAARPGPPPTLVRATYRATFADDALAGTGEWVVASSADTALSLGSPTVAVRDAKWPDGGPALTFDGGTKLWADRRGRTPVAFAWSARGVEEPGAVRFDLGLPPAPVAVLELDLPADRVPVVKGNQLVTGPVPKAGNRAAWRVAFGGDARLEFTVRRPAGVGLPPPFATLARTAKFDLQPGLAVGTFEFETVATRGPLSSLAFDLDPALTVTDVAAPSLETWRRDGNRLTLTFREPLTAGTITIGAVTTVPTAGEPWPPPLVRPVAGGLADDRIDVRVGADVHLDGWSPGDYRLLRTTTTDRQLTLVFRGTLPADAAAPRRVPALRAKAAAAEFATVEALDWRIDPQRSRLTGTFRVSVSRGPLTRLVFKIPQEFAPLSAVLTPDDPTAAWSAAGPGLWALEPTHPVPTNETIDVRVELRGPVPKAAGRTAWPVPVLSPVGAAKRDGTFAVQLAPPLRGWLSPERADADGLSLKYAQDFDATLTVAPRRSTSPAEGPPPEKPRPGGGWRFADLTTHCQFNAAGRPRAELTGRVTTAAAGALPIRLPAGAVVELATADGKWADGTTDGDTFSLPVPTPDADGVAFAVTYRLPPPGGWPPRFAAEPPELPGSPPVRVSVDVGPRYRAWPTLSAAAPPDARLVPVWLLYAVGFGGVAVVVGVTVGRFVRGHAGRATRLGLFLVATALGAAAWWTPDGWRLVVGPPLVAALVGVVLTALLANNGRAAAAILLAVIFHLPSTAQAPDPATVYFLQESPTDPNRLTALVPQAVLDRLAVLAAPPLPPVVLTAAEYVGSESNGTARFDAAWQVHVTRDGQQLLALPLAGVRLEAMTLDGATAYPDAARANQYSVTVSGKGRHELKATFAVPVGGAGGDREVRFGVPDLLASRATFALGGNRAPTVAARLGGQTSTLNKDTTTVAADLGRGGAVTVRWREAANAPAAPTVREATVWDVTETRAAALAAFLFQSNRGPLARLTFAIPPGLEPGQVTVRGADPAGGATGLRNWTLTPAADGAQELAIDLQNPAEGAVAVTFRLVPRDNVSARPVLRTPRATNADVTASYLGVRLANVAADGWQNENLIDFPADTVARDFAAVPELDFDKSLARSFRREGPNPPVARPALRATALPPPASYEWVWALGTHADVSATARWPSGTVSPFVECEVPAAVAVTDVSGNDLAGWERAGTKLRAWFKTEVKDPSLRWAGRWSAFAADAAVELPGVPGATVRVRPAADGAVTVQPARDGQLQPTPRPREAVYLAEAGPPPKVVAHSSGPVGLLQNETITRAGPVVEQRVTLDLTLAANRPHGLTVAVAGLPAGGETKVEWPAGASVVDAAAGPARRWQAVFAARPDAAARVVVVNRFPWKPDAALPAVDVLSAGVPAMKADQRLMLDDDLQPTGSRRIAGENAWQVATDDPVRLTEAAKPVVAVAVPEAATLPDPSPARPFDPRHLFATGWLVGMLLLAALAARGSPRLRPEVLTGFGLLAMVVGGWGFGIVAAAGVFLRLLTMTRAVAERVMR
jgi:hypothetical protein